MVVEGGQVDQLVSADRDVGLVSRSSRLRFMIDVLSVLKTIFLNDMICETQGISGYLKMTVALVKT